MATKQQAGRLDFLLQACHSMVLQNPTLARFYMANYQETLRLHHLSAPKAIDRLGCPRCGQVYLAGYNTSVELVPSKSNTKKNKKPSTDPSSTLPSPRSRKNTLIYTCHACQHRRPFNGSFKRHIPSSASNGVPTKLTEQPEQTTLMQPSIKPSTTPLSSTSTSKNKKTVDMKKQPTSTKSPQQQQQQPHKRSAPSTPQLSKKKSKKNQLQSLLANK
jgi:RNase P subunit RPR2